VSPAKKRKVRGWLHFGERLSANEWKQPAERLPSLKDTLFEILKRDWLSNYQPSS
jgi:hypothetical protein